MDVQTVVANALTLNTDNFVKPALQGLSDADIAKRPSDQCNSIAWLLWHQTRVEDAILSNAGGRPQVWAEGKWHERFGLPATAMGMGDTLEQVAAFKPALSNLQGYAEAVREKSLAVLKELSPAGLEREVPAPGGGTEQGGGERRNRRHG